MNEPLKLLREVYKPNESEVTRSIRNYLRFRGIPHFKHWSGPMSEKGIPDILGTIPGSGKSLAIEVKVPGWTPPTQKNRREYQHYLDQKRFIDEINRANGVAFFASSVEEVALKLQVR